MRGFGLGAILAIVATLATACGGGGPARTDVLDELGAAVIVPAYEQLAANAQALEQAAGALCAEPSEVTGADAHAALRAARASWKYTEAMWVGPVMERRSWALIDWPIAPDEIEALIADESAEIDVDRLARRVGADQRGLGAIEHLLGNREGGTAALTDPRRCTYLATTAAVVADAAERLLTDWRTSWEDGGPYRSVFSDPDSAGLDSIVSEALFLLEIIDLELGTALGVMDGPADADAIVEGPAALGVVDLEQRLSGLRAVLIGDGDAEGLGPLLGDELSDRLAAELAEAEAAVGALEPPLRRAAVRSTDAVAAAKDAVKVVQVTVSTEVVGRLGVTVGFSDADGDSSG